MIFRSIFFIHNYIKKFKHSLMLQKEKLCIKRQGWKPLNRMKMCTFFIFCLFFHLILPLKSYRRYLFPRTQNKFNLPWSSHSKSVQLQALNASWFFLKHQCTFCNSCMYKSLSCLLILFRSVLDKKNMHFVWSLFWILQDLQILHYLCKLVTTTVYNVLLKRRSKIFWSSTRLK